jgi:hypothetical protein
MESMESVPEAKSKAKQEAKEESAAGAPSKNPEINATIMRAAIISETAVFCTLAALGGGLFVLTMTTQLNWYYPAVFYLVVVYIAWQRYFGISVRVEQATQTTAEQEVTPQEVQRAGEAALQNYFEAVGELLIEKPLLRASPGDNLSTVVRAQTLSVLEGLDPERKRILLLFLYESGLIHKDKPVVSLVAANLREDNLSGADLRGAGITTEQLEQQAESLEEATRPDGSKHP